MDNLDLNMNLNITPRIDIPSSDMLDHRNQPHSLPRSDSTHRKSRTESRSGPRDVQSDAMAAFSEYSNEFAIDDSPLFSMENSQELKLPDLPQINDARKLSRSEQLVEPIIKPSPRVTYELRAKPPSFSLDDIDDDASIHSKASSTSSRNNKSVRPPFHNRKISKNNMNEKDDRDSLDAPSRIDSDHLATEDAEDDVCFPMSEEFKSAEGVDFDELDEFVHEARVAREETLSRTRTRKMSQTSQKTDHIFSEKEFSEPGTSSKYSSQFASPHLNAQKKNMYIPPIPHSNGIKLSKHPSMPKQSVYMPKSLTVENLRQVEKNQNAPDRFSFFTSERDDTVHAPDVGGLLEESNSQGGFKDLFRADRGVWWLDVMNPTDAEMKMLSKAFGIHPLTSEDIRERETREKVELFKNYYFVSFRSFDQDKDSESFLEPINVYIVVFREGLLSFHFAPIPHPANVRRRIRQLRDYVCVSADWISYAIIDDITDVFMPHIHEIEHETDAIEDAALIARSDDSGEMLRRIGECRRKVMALFRLLYAKADVLKMFAKRCNEQWDVAPKGEIGLYLGDIQDHLITMTQSLVQFEKILSRCHSNYIAQLSFDTIQSNIRVNAILGKITFIATAMVPMNLITGIFGMNVRVPWMDGPNLYPFIGICAIIGMSIFVSVIYARRSRLL